ILRSIIPRVHLAEDTELGSLICLATCLGTRSARLTEGRRGPPSFNALRRELLASLTDHKRADSLAATLDEVSRIGDSVRERLSGDMMLLLSQLRSSVRAQKGTFLTSYTVMLTKCLELLSAFSGMERENINRGSGWLFLSLGRRLERAIYLTQELRHVTKPLAVENWAYLERLLEVADSTVTYRTRYYTNLQPLAVLDLLMADEHNPRSLDFQLDHLAELYAKLPRNLSSDLQAIQDAVRSLRLIDLQALTERFNKPGSDLSDGYEEVDQFLARLEKLLPSWSNNLSSHYFSHARTLPITMGFD
ncbi:MAG TPA: alpha-E domain-containing protein, partial [Edaphobacter sp.]|nr:alpha-E domain-containing protein [Edaphobacter sp.]